MSDFKTYMSFIDADSSLELTALLEKNDIPYILQDTKSDFDPSMSLNEANKPYLIQIQEEDREKVDQLVKESYDISKVNKEHFLYSFSDDELIDVLKNEEEWHPLDVLLAKKLIQEKNIIIDEKKITSHQEEKRLKLFNYEKLPKYTIPIAYLICFAGGMLGFAIAIFLIVSKKTLPSGEKMYSYNPSVRRHAKIMLILSSILMFFLFKNLM
jgi:hypothetical protein